VGTYLSIAARNLLQAKRRTALLGGALAAVTLLLVVLMALTRGLVENTVQQATILLTGHVNVGGYFKTTPNDLVPVVADAKAVREAVEAAVPEKALVVDRMRGMAKIVGNSGSVFSMLAGVDPAKETRLRAAMRLAPERAYREGGGDALKGDLAGLGRKGNIVLFAAQAKRLGVLPGDTITLTAASQRGLANSADLVVAAVAEDIGLISSFAAFLSRDDLLDLYTLRDDTTGSFMIYLKDISQAEEVAARLRTVLASKTWRLMDASGGGFHKFESIMGEDWTGQKLDVTTWKDEVSFLDWIVTAFDTVSFLLIGVLLVIIGIGIMNTMWMAVRERTGEVGTLRAIGMQRRAVLGMFMTEALLLGFAATTAGALGGWVLSAVVDASHVKLGSTAARMVLLSDVLHLAPSAVSVVQAVLGFTAVTALSALWPAMRAARLQPVTAIHRVG